MTLEEAIEAALTGDSPPLRVYPDVLPSKVFYPASVYTVIFSQEQEDLTGNDNHLTLATVQIDTYATTRKEANAVSLHLRALMRGSSVFTASSGPAQNISEVDTRLYRRSRDFSVSMTT